MPCCRRRREGGGAFNYEDSDVDEPPPLVEVDMDHGTGGEPVYEEVHVAAGDPRQSEALEKRAIFSPYGLSATLATPALSGNSSVLAQAGAEVPLELAGNVGRLLAAQHVVLAVSDTCPDPDDSRPMIDPCRPAGSRTPTMSNEAFMIATALSAEHPDPFHGLTPTPWPNPLEHKVFWWV